MGGNGLEIIDLEADDYPVQDPYEVLDLDVISALHAEAYGKFRRT